MTSDPIKKVAFIDEVHPILKEQLLSKGIQCDDLTAMSSASLMAKISNYDGIVIRSKFKVDKPFLDTATSLKFIARAGAGMENIDSVYAIEKGVKLFNSPEGNRTAVAEHSMGMLLSLLNHLNRVDAEVRKGIWLRAENRGHELKGKTLAIIGYGNMGHAFAKRLSGFQVKVIAYDKYKKNYSDEYASESSWEEIYEQADVLSLHVPQAADTINLIDKERLAKFKKPIIVINTARGKNLSVSDLLDAIDEGKVEGACLDVLEFEGSSFEQLEQNNTVFKRLIACDKVILSPHIAGWTHESNYKLSDFLFKKIEAHYLL
jgi:D-3-phosphoglycerate dehydrogenase